jgi:hypothetical protein
MPACRIRLTVSIQVPKHPQLKHLYLRGFTLTYVSPEPIQVLLKRTVDSMETLDLEDYGIRDQQLTVRPPALSHCSQLTMFRFYGNLPACPEGPPALY